ncbi:serine/threonine protein kinase [Micromonospora sp. B9E7]|uniref:serine/threonine protein kinase n=1 Tax=Micromonospora sp. B9E7 TaxID=3153574 RepID=UPI00325CB2F6
MRRLAMRRLAMRRLAMGRLAMPPVEAAFAVFDAQDSGCLSYGVEVAGQRWFVKTATTATGRASLDRACAVHAAVRHPVIVHPVRTDRGPAGPTLVYPWYDGRVLNHATVHGADRSGLARFQQLPVPQVDAALDAILDAHLAVSAAGLVAVDLYDGCLLYDFSAGQMRLIDLDEYRPGPFVLDAERLPGSRRYMAPEEFVRGAVIDERTTVHLLGRTVHHLLDSSEGWRGNGDQRRVVERATAPVPAARYDDVPALVRAWRLATP